MSHLEHEFRQFLSKRPEIEKCCSQGLLNRRSLARFIIKKGLAKQDQLEAVIAMLRRFEFAGQKDEKDLLKDFRINIKDRILILDFEKDKNLLKELQRVVANIDYDKGDTLKIVVGSSSIKVFVDKKNESMVKKLTEPYNLCNRFDDISEISLLFPKESMKTRGLLSTITRELALNDVVISELLTASPELLIYLKEEYVLLAYEVLKRLSD